MLPQAYVAIIFKLVFSLLVLLATVIINRIVLNMMSFRFKDPAHLHTIHMLVRNTIFLAGAILILVIWLGVGSNFTVAMGILGAGIAFASQELIGSFAGYLNIVTSSLFRIGDRVRIGHVVGDVLDISMFRTTVMEIGEWVHADQYTGRVVTVANRVVFSDPVFNYTQHWPYLWDEITVPITYASDWQRVSEVMLAHGRKYTEEFQAQASAGLEKLMQIYPIYATTVQPALYSVMTDNWIEMTLRYVVDARQRRAVKAELHRELLQHFQEEPNITIASMTVEIVGMPSIKGHIYSATGASGSEE